MSENNNTSDCSNMDNDNTSDCSSNTVDNNAQESEPQSQTEQKGKPKFSIYKAVRIVCLISFIVFTSLFINETVIQPYRIKKSIGLTRDLYYKPEDEPVIAEASSPAPTVAISAAPIPEEIVPTPIPEEAVPTPIPEEDSPTPTPDPNRDEHGRLLKFKDLLAVNEDVKGWIKIDGTNIDYVVMQSDADDPDYYLDKDIEGKYSKAGTLYLDIRSSVEKNTQSYVIHGHNMVSTREKMFHYLLDYKDPDFYKEHPIISFDTIYEEGLWKIFAIIKATPKVDKDYFFEYRKSTFADSSEFLNFVYQLRIRSLLVIEGVDINENDQLLALSTCSYEVDKNYRTVIYARKVRDGEDPAVDVDSVYVNENPLYADDYYYNNGGKAPKLPATFEEALANNEINWYTPSGNN